MFKPGFGRIEMIVRKNPERSRRVNQALSSFIHLSLRRTLVH